MIKDYTKLCPKLSKYIPKEKVDIDFAPREVLEEAKPNLTKAKAEEAYEMLLIDPQYLPIAIKVGLTQLQIKELHQEMLAYQNWTEPEITE